MIRRLVLDVLKPHEPGIVAITTALSEIDGVVGATAKLVEMEEKVQTIRVSVEGTDLDIDELQEVIDDLGGSLHSIDEVSCGDEIVRDRWVAN